MRGLLLPSVVLAVGCTTEPVTSNPVVTTTTGVAPGTTSGEATGNQSGSGMVTASETTTSGGSSSSGSVDGDTTAGAIFDLGSIPDVRPAECLECEISLDTTQSNALVSMGMPLFAEADLDGQLVFGLAEAGAGRLAFSGDGNVIYREGSCPLWEWLGDTGTEPPRVLCIGSDWPCHGETGANPPLEINHLHMYPGQLDYGGLTLPRQYEGDAAALHADYDLVVYFAVLDLATGGWDFDAGDVDTLESFARDEGGGLYFVAEYFGGGMGQPQVDSFNALVAPYDLGVAQESLAWGPAGASVELECFPDPAG